MSTNFKSEQGDETEEAKIHRVIMALENPNWEWRTLTGVTKETQLSPEEVQEIISKLGKQVIKSKIPDAKGLDLYTTREYYRRRKREKQGANRETVAIDEAIDQLSEAKPEDIQEIAGSQIRILNTYHNLALKQADQSFRWAQIAAIVGFGFFLGAIAFLLLTQSQSFAIVNVICGAIVEGVSSLNFYLHGQATKQLAYYHRQLDQTQRFLLANSVCEALDGESRQKSRSDLVKLIVTFRAEKAFMTPSDKQQSES